MNLKFRNLYVMENKEYIIIDVLSSSLYNSLDIQNILKSIFPNVEIYKRGNNSISIEFNTKNILDIIHYLIIKYKANIIINGDNYTYDKYNFNVYNDISFALDEYYKTIKLDLLKNKDDYSNNNVYNFGKESINNIK